MKTSIPICTLIFMLFWHMQTNKLHAQNAVYYFMNDDWCYCPDMYKPNPDIQNDTVFLEKGYFDLEHDSLRYELIRITNSRFLLNKYFPDGNLEMHGEVSKKFIRTDTTFFLDEISYEQIPIITIYYKLYRQDKWSVYNKNGDLFKTGYFKDDHETGHWDYFERSAEPYIPDPILPSKTIIYFGNTSDTVYTNFILAQNKEITAENLISTFEMICGVSNNIFLDKANQDDTYYIRFETNGNIEYNANPNCIVPSEFRSGTPVKWELLDYNTLQFTDTLGNIFLYTISYLSRKRLELLEYKT